MARNRKAELKKLLQVVKTRTSTAGEYYNVCFDDRVTSMPDFETVCAAIEAHTGIERKWRARRDPIFDSSGRIWLDVYFYQNDPFAERRAQMASAEGGAA